MSNEIVPFVPDYQTVSALLTNYQTVSAPAGIYINGELHPFTSHCATCKEPFQAQHVVEISNFDPVYRHRDCVDPTLAATDD